MRNLSYWLIIIACLLTATAITQDKVILDASNTAINNTGANPDNSAILDITSTDKGLLIPRMTTAQRTAISSPAEGLMVYDTNTDSFWFYKGAAWSKVGNDNLGNHIASQPINMGLKKILNLGYPTGNNDAARKGYVDNHVDGDSDPNNEIETWSTLAGIPIGFSDGVDNVNDGDASDTNEKIVSITLAPNNNLIINENGVLHTESLSPLIGPFYTAADIVRNSGNHATEDLLFGRYLWPSTSNISDNFFFFDKSKGAFRVGILQTSNVWQPSKIGFGSFASGRNTESSGTTSFSHGTYATASGAYSVAFGLYPEASGEHSVALGHYNEATGDYSTALGYSTEASGDHSFSAGLLSTASGKTSTALGKTTASGENSFAAGTGTSSGFTSGLIGSGLASGNYSFAAGSSSSTNDFAASLGNSSASGTYSMASGKGNASGDYSVSMGRSTKSVGNYSFALGQNSEANGAHSIAIGWSCIADGHYAHSFGRVCEASGIGSIAGGDQCESNGNNSIGLGFNSIAENLNSIAIGYINYSTGNQAVTLGSQNNSSGLYSFSIGNSNLAQETKSASIGFSNNSQGAHSISLGSYLESNGYGSLAIGRYNDAVVSPSTIYSSFAPALTVGNGTGNTNRSNAFEVYFNGDAYIDRKFLPMVDNYSDIGSFALRFDDVYATNGTIQTSDLRAKKNIEEINYGLAEVLQLETIVYNWNEEQEGDKKHLGVSAQQLLVLIPEVVAQSENADDLLGVKYAALTPILIKAIQELHSENEQLKSKIAQDAQALETRLGAIEAQLSISGN